MNSFFNESENVEPELIKMENEWADIMADFDQDDTYPSHFVPEGQICRVFSRDGNAHIWEGSKKIDVIPAFAPVCDPIFTLPPPSPRRQPTQSIHRPTNNANVASGLNPGNNTNQNPAVNIPEARPATPTPAALPKREKKASERKPRPRKPKKKAGEDGASGLVKQPKQEVVNDENAVPLNMIHPQKPSISPEALQLKRDVVREFGIPLNIALTHATYNNPQQ